MRVFAARSGVCLAGLALFGVLLSAGCGDLLTGDDDGTAKNWAVIVGVSDYKTAALGLKWAEEDALDFYDVLNSGRGWDAENLKLLTNGSATKEAIRAAIDGLAKRVSADDRVVFFFSGRGSYGPDQPPFDEADGLEEYLLPYDAQLNSSAQDLSDDELETLLSALPTHNVLIVLDAGFAGSASRAGVPSEKEKCLIRTSSRQVSPRSVDGMSHDLARPGFVFVSAAQNGVAPAESSQLRHGVFSYYFLEGLRGAAGTGKKTSAQQAFTYAAPHTSSSGSGQTPQMIDNLRKSFPLAARR
jgi:uncharacterized caspase-like protein